jgi:hypothetical protein
MAQTHSIHPDLQALARKAGEELRQIKPELFSPKQPATPEEIAELDDQERELERIWEEIDHTANGDRSYTSMEAVNEDRGGEGE